MGKYRAMARVISAENEYTDDPVTLGLGVCEEAGELGKAINWYHNPLYKHNPRSKIPDTAEHEMLDLLIYMGTVANALNLDIDF
jgi:NTP pyrophosphatase (non-canonical NTP hydrolase)